MRLVRLLIARATSSASLVFFAFLPALIVVSAQVARRAPADAFLLDGARLIDGTGGTPLESSSILVQDGRIASVGRRGTVRAPEGVRRIDVTGQTIIPALVDTHVHLGYQKGLSFATANFTRDTLIDHLRRFAYCGVGAVLSLGTDPGELPFQIRAEQEAGRLDGALYLSAGRGLAAPNAGPGTPELKPSAYGVSTEDEARAAVREQVAHHVAFIKIWVDDRNGTVEKLRPSLYRAAIDEAHRANTRVIAYVFYLDDAKDLVRAGIDGFAHLPRDREADADLSASMKARGVFMIPNLSVSENGVHAEAPAWLDDPFLRETVSQEEIDRLRASYARRSPEAVQRARATYAGMQRSLMTLKRAGVTIAFGTDAGAVRDHFYAYMDHHELQLMVAAGLSPMEALTAATRTSAQVLRLGDRGTIAPGKSADLVVLRADPLSDIANTETIAAVYLRGVEVDREHKGHKGY